MSRRRSTTRIRKGVYIRQNRRRVSVPSSLGTVVTVALVLLAVWLGAKGGLLAPAAHSTAPAGHGTPSVSRTHVRH